ncbi:MAG TPA: bifunctional diguanylate cyclase/phosphodiesterase, partial [Chloroflexota bacterium]|nr:bifunctional diguanylate cyclase/phosphodiesterase [Chloroflexota bacterium]
LDLDRFKEINDTFGHQEGDQVLREVARRLQGRLRASDTVARLGGDEFAVLLPDTDAGGATVAAVKLSAALEAPFQVIDHILHVRASIGIAIAPTHGGDVPSLLRHADVAMYAAKRAGGGHAIYDAAQDQHTPGRLALEHELREVISANRLVLHYQPTVDVRTGRVEGVEALVRWPHARQGLIPPDQFIPLAELTGLIVPLTHWVLEEALRQCQVWQRTGLRLGMAVNLSMRALHDPTLPAALAWLLRRYSIAPERLTLEITESALMGDPAQAQTVLQHLTEIGVHLAIDDFGTGYSSLAYLKQMPVDAVKIDKEFVKNMGKTETKDHAIVRSIIELGHNLGLSVVAEGVEDRETWQGLQTAGCDTAQGFYLSRPVSAPDLDQWLATMPWADGCAPHI